MQVADQGLRKQVGPGLRGAGVEVLCDALEDLLDRRRDVEADALSIALLLARAGGAVGGRMAYRPFDSAALQDKLFVCAQGDTELDGQALQMHDRDRGGCDLPSWRQQHEGCHGDQLHEWNEEGPCHQPALANAISARRLTQPA